MSAQNVDNMKTRKFIKYTKRGDKILFDNVLSCRVIIEKRFVKRESVYPLALRVFRATLFSRTRIIKAINP